MTPGKGSTADRPFAERLALASSLVDRLARADRSELAPLHVLDQLSAAASETLAFVPPIIDEARRREPDRGWRHRVEAATPEKSAYLLAALLGCMDTVCAHLRRGGPQPAIANLALRRLDCRRCVGTVRRPPPEDADVCDVCGTRLAAPWFYPLVATTDPVLVVGDACSTCAAALGLGEREAAS
jgi:hypothetical protein